MVYNGNNDIKKYERKGNERLFGDGWVKRIDVKGLGWVVRGLNSLSNKSNHPNNI